MDYQVAWTEAAREDYRSIASHLLDHYDFEVADRFTDAARKNSIHRV
jgi:plasmid stabilization system protein ParE